MQNVRNPWWLLIINTLPVFLLASIYYGSFDTIHSLLSPESIRIWKLFAVALGILWTTHLLYAIIMIWRKREVGATYGLLSFFMYSASLYIYYFYSDIAIPVNIPGWMLPEDITIFVGTFIMPTLAHALFLLVVVFTRSANGLRAWISFGIAFIIPVAWYVFFQVVLPLWQLVSRNQYYEHILIILVLVATVLFLFFIMRGIYIIAAKRGRLWSQYGILWRFILALVFPLIGLMLNDSIEYNGFFGNFSNKWFYILAVFNGIVITFPEVENSRLRMVVFFFRSITIVYVAYFFIVFLPYLPLSVIAIVFIGAGFLMLTPLILMVLQLRIMSDDIHYLRKQYSGRLVFGTLAAGVVIIPAVITFVYVNDRATLTRALTYTYTPDLRAEPAINTKALNRVLHTVRRGKEKSWGRKREGATPYLSTYYSWLVLDNLTLSYVKINTLDRIFNGTPPLDSLSVDQSFDVDDKHVSLKNIINSSVYDDKQQAWKSTIELELYNESSWQSEYATSFELPAGCWVSDYYLWIGNEKVKGILAEKKTATWVYHQIVSERRDPGILYYLTGNRVALRVFPFAGKEVRKTGFEILHKDSASLTIDGQHITLGDNRELPAVFESSGAATYVSAKAKQRLPKVRREAKYHFVIDCSIPQHEKADTYIKQIENFANDHSVALNTSTFTLCNAYAKQTSSWEDTKAELKNDVFSGGFFLERAIQKILIRNYLDHSDKQPVIVVVSPDFSSAILRKDFADLNEAFPESDLFFELNEGKLLPHSLSSSPKQVTKQLNTYGVAEWKNKEGNPVYLRLNDQASVVFDPAMRDENPAMVHEWKSALSLQGNWLEQQFYPERSKSEWLALVKASFQSQIMSPVTSFISLENEAQEKALLKKQEDVLKSNPSLDIGEEVRMSEPGSWMVLVFLGILAVRWRDAIVYRFISLRRRGEAAR